MNSNTIVLIWTYGGLGLILVFVGIALIVKFSNELKKASEEFKEEIAPFPIIYNNELDQIAFQSFYEFFKQQEETQKRLDRIERLKAHSKRPKPAKYVMNGSGIPPIWRRRR